ncbi:MAG: hypothetical protein K1X55_01355 [Chitinophagales bacterium]|nr:hypothetical protein [Chitinophagales bacterium]
MMQLQRGFFLLMWMFSGMSLFGQNLLDYPGIWYFQGDNYTQKDSVLYPYNKGYVALKIGGGEIQVISPQSLPEPKEYTLQYSQSTATLQEYTAYLNGNEWIPKAINTFKINVLNKDSLVLKKISVAKNAKDSLCYFRRFTAFDIDSMLQGKKWIHPNWNTSNIHEFQLLGKNREKFARPHLVFDLSKADDYRNEFGAKGGFNGTQITISVIGDSMLTIDTRETPGIIRKFKILAIAPTNFILEELTPEKTTPTTKLFDFVTNEHLCGKYSWQMEQHNATLQLNPNGTFDLHYSNTSADTTIYAGVYMRDGYYLYLYPWVYQGNENLEWKTREQVTIKKFYLKEPLKLEMLFIKNSPFVHLSGDFIGGVSTFVLEKPLVKHP